MYFQLSLGDCGADEVDDKADDTADDADDEDADDADEDGKDVRFTLETSGESDW